MNKKTGGKKVVIYWATKVNLGYTNGLKGRKQLNTPRVTKHEIQNPEISHSGLFLSHYGQLRDSLSLKPHKPIWRR